MRICEQFRQEALAFVSVLRARWILEADVLDDDGVVVAHTVSVPVEVSIERKDTTGSHRVHDKTVPLHHLRGYFVPHVVLNQANRCTKAIWWVVKVSLVDAEVETHLEVEADLTSRESVRHAQKIFAHVVEIHLDHPPVWKARLNEDLSNRTRWQEVARPYTDTDLLSRRHPEFDTVTIRVLVVTNDPTDAVIEFLAVHETVDYDRVSDSEAGCSRHCSPYALLGCILGVDIQFTLRQGNNRNSHLLFFPKFWSLQPFV